MSTENPTIVTELAMRENMMTIRHRMICWVVSFLNAHTVKMSRFKSVSSY